MKNLKILIYGVGRNSLRYWEKFSNVGGGYSGSVIGFVETQKKHDIFCGLPVHSVDEIDKLDYDEIHLANVHVETLYALLERNVKKEKIVVGDYRLYIEYAKQEGGCDLRFSFPALLIRPMIMEKSIGSEDILFAGSVAEADYDYVRHMTLKLLAKEITERNISGDIAELGVFQGHFASLMNTLFPDRTFHLFDTFEGFAENDKTYEIEQGYTRSEKFLGKGEFANTSVDIVLAKMKHPEKMCCA